MHAVKGGLLGGHKRTPVRHKHMLFPSTRHLPTNIWSKGVGPGPTLAWPGWSSLIFQWRLTRANLKQVSSKNVAWNVYYCTTPVLISRVLLMYTDMVKELPGYPEQNCPSGSFLFLGGPVGRCGIVYDIVWRRCPRRTPWMMLRTPVCSYPIIVTHLSFNFLCLLLLYSIYLNDLKFCRAGQQLVYLLITGLVALGG